MIFALSLGDSVVNHLASLCSDIISQESYASTERRRQTYNFALPREQHEISRGAR